MKMEQDFADHAADDGKDEVHRADVFVVGGIWPTSAIPVDDRGGRLLHGLPYAMFALP